MTALPLRCVVDTNVPLTANGANPEAPSDCVASSAKALQAVMASGHLFIDDGRRIVGEYCNKLKTKGEPGPGDRFLKWLLTHEYAEQRVTQVKITQQPDDDEDFVELPRPPTGIHLKYPLI